MVSKKTKKIQDAVFGELKFDVLWEGHIAIEPLGAIEVLVDGGNNGDPPTEAQRNASVELQRAMPNLIDKIYDALFSYYCDHRDVYLPNALDPEVEVPVLTSSNEIHRVLVGPPALVVGYHRRKETPSLNLDWHVRFDEEHSMAVEIVNGEIRDVGIV